MQIHTSLTLGQVVDCLIQAQDAGQVSQRVDLDKAEVHGSRTHARRVDVHLYSYVKDAQHTRHTNPGTATRFRDEGTHYAATYDEWGWFLARVFAADPDARADRYNGQAGFDATTRYAYVLEV